MVDIAIDGVSIVQAPPRNPFTTAVSLPSRHLPCLPASFTFIFLSRFNLIMRRTALACSLPLLTALLTACQSVGQDSSPQNSSDKAPAAIVSSTPSAGSTSTTAGSGTPRMQPLVVEAFTPGANAIFSVASVLIQGKDEVMLIDAQFSAADARKLVESIRTSGKRLSTIYISHGDPDYYFGLATLKDAFPQARVLATPQTIEHIRQTWDSKIKVWGPQLGDNAPNRLVLPEALQGDTLMLEGQELKIVGLDGPTPDRSFVWIPSIRTVVGGIPVIGNEHVWMADTQSPQSHADWLATLERLTSLDPVVVIPGHFADGAPLDLRSVKFTADYIRAFDEETARSADSETLIAAMKRRYPGLPGEESLALSAKVAKGEMEWK